MKEIVQSHSIEFGYELILILPYAYWLYKNNKLDFTISNKDMKCFYFFDENHKEISKRRDWSNIQSFKNSNIPNKILHTPNLDFSKWLMPNFKEEYSEKILIIKSKKYKNRKSFESSNKPLIIVSNKYNVEWGKKPVNFINSDTLDNIFTYLEKKYTIIYNHMVKNMGYDDTVDSLNLNEFNMIKNKHKNVIIIQDLLKSNQINYNELQLRLYSKCRNFLSIQGGTSVLSSLFGGKNLIFANRGHELNQKIFQSWYHKLGDTDIYLAGSEESINQPSQKSWNDLILKTKQLF